MRRMTAAFAFTFFAISIFASPIYSQDSASSEQSTLSITVPNNLEPDPIYETSLATIEKRAIPGRPTFRLINLGETDVTEDGLYRTSQTPSLAPCINNLGQVIGNRKEGGFLTDPLLGDWMPYINQVTVHFHAITNNGDILVSLNRKTNDPEWMVWPTAAGKNGPRASIQTEDFPKAQFIGLTNDRIAIANVTIDKQVKPLLWRPGEKTQQISNSDGEKAFGYLKGINNNGQIAAILQNGDTSPPAVCNKASNIEFMRNFRSKVFPNGKAELADLVIAEDGTVYGTYKIHFEKDKTPSEYYAYAWFPYEGGGFKLLDLQGMRISALNDWHILVGSHDGQAALCEPGSFPVVLSSVIRKEELEDWELIEATGINNWGDIVGYGKFKGNMHIFLAQRENNQAPYNQVNTNAK